MHQNRIPTYPNVSCYLLLLPKKPNLWYRPLTMGPCLPSSLIYYYQLQFLTFLFQMAELVTVNTGAVFQLQLFDFFDPPGLLDVVLTTTEWDLVVDEFAANALQSVAATSAAVF